MSIKFISASKIHLKYQLLINGREKVVIENLKDPKAFINYLQTFDDAYKNLEDFIIQQRKGEY